MRVFLSALRETSDPPPFHSSVVWLERLGHTVFLQSAKGGRAALGVDLNWICKNAEAVAFLPGFEKSKYSESVRRIGECFDLFDYDAPARR
jgi:hypothetical protein